MPKPTPTPAVTLELGGKARSLRLGYLGIAALEDKFPGPSENPMSEVDALFKRAEAGSPNALASVVWACLLHEDEALTVPQVIRWLDGVDIGEIAGAVRRATTASTGDVGGAKPGDAEGNAIAA